MMFLVAALLTLATQALRMGNDDADCHDGEVVQMITTKKGNNIK
jgi:hypothetical protein